MHSPLSWSDYFKMLCQGVLLAWVLALVFFGTIILGAA